MFWEGCWEKLIKGSKHSAAAHSNSPEKRKGLILKDNGFKQAQKEGESGLVSRPLNPGRKISARQSMRAARAKAVMERVSQRENEPNKSHEIKPDIRLRRSPVV